MSKVYIARELLYDGSKTWVMFDEKHVLSGEKTMKSLVARWRSLHGNFTTLVRIKGVCRPSELTMQITELRMEKKDGQ